MEKCPHCGGLCLADVDPDDYSLNPAAVQYCPGCGWEERRTWADNDLVKQNNSPMKPITLDDEIRELEREISLRHQRYPDWTKGPAPRLKPDVAEHQLACLRATLDRLKRLRTQLLAPQQSIL